MAVLVCATFGLLYAVLYRTAFIERWHRLNFASRAILVAGLLLLPTQTYDAFHFLLFVLGMQAVAVLSRRPALAWVALLVVISAVTTVLQHQRHRKPVSWRRLKDELGHGVLQALPNRPSPTTRSR